MLKSKLSASIIGLSGIIGIFLLWFIYYGPNLATNQNSFLWLPGFNASMNGISTALVIAGVWAIMNKKRRTHMALMGGAIVASGLFLVGYLLHHSLHGDTVFMGEGLVRLVYFSILISHVILTFFALPLILLAVTFALLGKFDQHKAVVRYTVPIWLYVSITGIVIYFFPAYVLISTTCHLTL